MPLLQMMHQPMCHFMGHDFGKESIAVLTQESSIEAQPTSAKMRLTGALSSQIEPDVGIWQRRKDIPTQLNGHADLTLQAGFESCLIQRRQSVG
ncbi:hypothetical protein SAMN05443545_102201 [Aidingimonas halophila]|uniref:Uncharacterized protein n=1 Tax=Aidingimonas halophila TaxID=574349 RepID=A0A1H2UNR3_9GAMM|nr:hypothetical protein SAMN05443545_102201 [Aidingimonas halophila]